MTDSIRRLNPAGEAAYAAYVAEAKAGTSSAPPWHLLTDPTFSAPLDTQVGISRPMVTNRYEFGRLLVTVLEAFDARLISRDHGLWNWLGLYFLDLTAPPDEAGRRKSGEAARHVVTAKFDYQRYYRHLVREAWMAVRIHGEVVQALLSGPPDVRGDLIEQLGSRQTIFNSPSLMAASMSLYLDQTSGRPKRGAGGKGGGSPRRLSAILQQLVLNYDLYSSTPDKIVTLLPAEFARWSA
jgi:hypothetical protein